MAENGFIKLFRSMTKWEWYKNSKTKNLFIHLILTVNYEDKQWRGVTIKRGQLACSYSNLSLETGLSVKEVRTALDHLISTGEVAYKGQSKYGIITLKNFDKFQDSTPKEADEGQAEGTQTALKGQTNGTQRATTKEVKKLRIQEEYEPPLPPKGEAADFENLEEKIDLQAESLAIETVAAPEAKPKNKTSDEHSATLAEHFKIFWEAYPKKVSKPPAEKAFKKLKPDKALLEAMLTGIEKAKKSREWQKNKGEFIPYPSSWLNKRRWEDQETEVLKNGQNGSTYGANNPNPWLKGFVE